MPAFLSWAGLKAEPIAVTTGRTLSDRLHDVINVKNYGAVGDGVTNDRVALQKAIHAAFGGAIFTGYISVNSATPGTAGKTLTVTALTTGVINLYARLTGPGITGGPYISAFDGTGTGGTGTYTISTDQLVGSIQIAARGYGQLDFFRNRPLFIPGGIYATDGPLYMDNSWGAHVYGAGMRATHIKNINPSNPSCFVTNGVGYSTFADFHVSASTGGIAFDYDWDGGGYANGQIVTFDKVMFSGGAEGCRVGYSQFQCDTSTWFNCYWENGTDYGLGIRNYNALQNNVIGGYFLNNGTGIYVPAGSCPLISDCTFIGNTTIDIQNYGGALDTCYVTGCRSESVNFLGSLAENVAFSVIDCMHDNDTEGGFVNCFGSMTLIDCWTKSGWLGSGNQSTGRLTVINCRYGDGTPEIPLHATHWQGRVNLWPLRTTTYAELPTLRAVGMEASITNGNASTFGAHVTATGSTPAKIRWNGSFWTVMGI